jgi:hypothetical protein
MNNNRKAIIIWLDENIGRSEYYQLIKRTFAKIFVREWDCATFLDDNTIESLVKNDFSKSSYWYKTSAIELYALSNEEDCAQFIEENKEERIFFIVSLSLGKRVMPQIIQRFPGAFRKSTDHRFRSIYVSRYNSPAADQLWSLNYSEYMLGFKCETDLVKKLINDIGCYFINLGQKQYELKTFASIRRSLEYFDWAKILFGRVFGGVNAWQCKEITRNLEKEIAQSEAALRNSSNITDIDQYILSSDSTNMSKAEIPKLYEQISFDTTIRPALIEPTNVQNNHLLAEYDNSISSPNNSEKLLSLTQELVGDKQSSSEIRVYLEVPSTQTENFKNFQSILKHLFSKILVVSSEVQNYYMLFEANDSPIVVRSLSDNDDERALEKLCSRGTLISLYLLGTEPGTVDARRDFFTRFPQVCAIMDDPKELAVKIALDIALKSRIMGERYARNKDKEHANRMFDQCINLLNGLNAASLNNMDHRN